MWLTGGDHREAQGSRGPVRFIATRVNAVVVMIVTTALVTLGTLIPTYGGVASASSSGYSTHFTPSVPNPTTATAAQLNAARGGGIAPLISGPNYGPPITASAILSRAQLWVTEHV